MYLLLAKKRRRLPERRFRVRSTRRCFRGWGLRGFDVRVVQWAGNRIGGASPSAFQTNIQRTAETRAAVYVIRFADSLQHTGVADEAPVSQDNLSCEAGE